MKHLLKLSALLLALIIPATALAHDFEVNGIYYDINGSAATVTSSPSSNQYSGSVTIPSTVTYGGTTYPVTAIGSSAFFGCSSLTAINIPNSVTSIGMNAFYGTAWFNNQPDGVVYAGLVAYKYKGTMPEGTSIILKDGTIGIADYAFRDCTRLTNINIPNSVTTIGSAAFSLCSSLTNINIPNSVTTIGSGAFAGTAWYNNQPDGLIYAGLVAYQYKGTMPEGTSITLKEGTIGIVDCAFSGCSSLTNIFIPNSVTNIGEDAFYNCSSLTNINIPNSVTSISNYAFSGCSSLTTVTIGNSVKTIGDYAFSGCSSLTAVTIGNSVKTIGSYAFWYCSGLTKVNIGNSVTTIGDYAFGDCTSLTAVTIGNSVTSIGTEVFSYCESLTSINIPNSVTTIGNSAFADCSSLTRVNIPNSVSSIERWAFAGCYSINSVYSFAPTPPSCDYETFSDYSATLHVPAASLAAYFTAPEWSNFENIVGDAIETTGISISSDSIEIQSGEQIELTATVTPANASCKEVTWYSTDTSVATVENGIVTAVSLGECDIYAYCMGMPAICHVSVSNRISLEQNEAMLLPNHMLVLNPTAPAMPAGFTVTSSDPTVAAARVMNGKVQIVGIKEGTTTITVASTDGTAQPATCLVTVYTESGDVDMDGFVNINDVTVLIDYLLNSETPSFKEANADLDGDGNVNITDVTSLIDRLLATFK